MAIVASLALANFATADDWPQWQGPNRDGKSDEAGLLQTWPEGGPRRVWLFEECGVGYAGPAVADGKLYIMGGDDLEAKLLTLDAATGEPIRETPLGEIVGGGKEWFGGRWGEGPRGTPTVDGERVYALSGAGVLACVARESGSILWKTTMQEHGGVLPAWAYSESPLVDGELLLVTPGVAGEDKYPEGAVPRDEAGAIVAFDKLTGEVRWRSTDIKDPAHYSSIIKAEVHGKKQYIQLLEKRAVGVDAETGKLLWQTEWPGRVAVIPTPIFLDNHVYLTSGYGIGSKLIRIAPDNQVEEVYFNKVMKNHHGGVILHKDHLYGHSDGVGWLCQEPMSGERVWRNRDALEKGAITYAGGRFYCLGEETGDVVLVEPSTEEWIERGRFTLSPQSDLRKDAGAIWTHPVIADGKLYLRDQNLLYCYDVAEK